MACKKCQDDQRRGRMMQHNLDKSGRETCEKGCQITVLTDEQRYVKPQRAEGKT